jgi:hypothetical protein
VAPEPSGLSVVKSSMKPHLIAAALLLFVQSGFALPDLGGLARLAVSEDAAVAKDAVAMLRAAGHDGLNALFAAHLKDLAQGPRPSDPNWTRLASAIDAVAGQRDAFASRLYWYTDFEKAKAAAKATNRPILSLRLLGRLDEEYSCANSRLFRTTLYCDPTVSNLLRDGYILHWKSVRPAPRITVDFGDGRRIERTITGNSIHYVLDSDGRLVDAIPGLYGPAAFTRHLVFARQISARFQQIPDRASRLAQFHSQAAEATLVSISRDVKKSGVAWPKAAPVAQRDAVAAAPIAVSKVQIERPLVRALTARDPIIQDEEAWTKLAALHAADAKLSDGARALITSKASVDTTMFTRLEAAVALDTVRNEYLLRPRLHQWFATGLGSDVEAFNSRVYAELFLTPNDDPWLGLAPQDIFSALDSNGLAAPVASKQSAAESHSAAANDF